MKLKMAPGLELPLQAVTERFAFMGQSGSGKTYAAMRLAELMLDVGAQVIVLDPVGPWWGLRAAADGKSAGYPVNVFGGNHGDVQITPSSGNLVADVVAEKGVSAVIDVSDFTVGEMHTFVVGFAERFFDRKKSSPTPVHLFLEEAHTFVPQQLPPDLKAALMLHRVERIVRVGRNYGIGSSLISQMPQSVNKKSLNQAGTLFAMRTFGKNERKAIADWMADKATSEGELDLDSQLKQLETGEAWVASPQWLKFFKCVKVSRKTTFDSSKTPEFGAELRAPKVLAPVDVEALREAMAEVVKVAEADDPEALRRRIAELERQVTAKKPEPALALDAVGRRAVVERLLRVIDSFQGGVRDLFDVKGLLGIGGEGIAIASGSFGTPTMSFKGGPAPATRSPQAAATPTSKDLPGLKKGARVMLHELAELHPRALSRRELATRAGMSHGGGSFSDYLSALRSRGFVEHDDAGDVRLTGDGLHAGYTGKGPRRREEIIHQFGFKRGARTMLAALLEAHPRALSRAELAAAAGMEEGGGSFSDYLSNLRSSGCADQVGKEYVAGHALFLGSAA